MTKDKKGSHDIKSFLDKLRRGSEKGGAFYEKSTRLHGTVKGASIGLANQLKKAMKAKDTEVITVRRQNLPTMIGMICLEDPESGKPPTIKDSVREHLRARGIRIKTRRIGDSFGLIDFYKAETKKY